MTNTEAMKGGYKPVVRSDKRNGSERMRMTLAREARLLFQVVGAEKLWEATYRTQKIS